jgi:hypothetical protein
VQPFVQSLLFGRHNEQVNITYRNLFLAFYFEKKKKTYPKFKKCALASFEINETVKSSVVTRALKFIELARAKKIYFGLNLLSYIRYMF